MATIDVSAPYTPPDGLQDEFAVLVLKVASWLQDNESMTMAAIVAAFDTHTQLASLTPAFRKHILTLAFKAYLELPL